MGTHGKLKSKTTPQIVIIIKYYNGLLDVLNSRSLYNSIPFKCAISNKRLLQLELFKKATLKL